jgi:hypothetical protein
MFIASDPPEIYGTVRCPRLEFTLTARKDGESSCLVSLKKIIHGSFKI